MKKDIRSSGKEVEEEEVILVDEIRKLKRRVKQKEKLEAPRNVELQPPQQHLFHKSNPFVKALVPIDL